MGSGRSKKLRAAFELILAPQEFELPRHVDGGWEIGGFHYAENPRWSTPSWALRLMKHWQRLQRMNMGPLGPTGAVLPQAGGYYDQTAMVMDAFELFDLWVAQRKANDD